MAEDKKEREEAQEKEPEGLSPAKMVALATGTIALAGLGCAGLGRYSPNKWGAMSPLTTTELIKKGIGL